MNVLMQDKDNRTMLQGNMNKIVHVSLLLILLFLQGCVLISTTDDFPQDIFLRPEDLPEGWIQDQVSSPDSDVADIRARKFINLKTTNNPIIWVRHDIALFSSELEAQNKFAIWVTENLPRPWQTPQDFRFSPIDGNDQYEIKCLDQIIDQKKFSFCNYLQQHKNIIMVIRGRLDYETLNMEEFIYTVEQVDIRLQNH